MPIYVWKCEECGDQCEMVRPVKEMDEPPEALDAASDHHHKWHRVPARVQPHQHGPNFTGRKGHW